MIQPSVLSLSEMGANDTISPSPCKDKPATPKMLVLCFDGTGDQFDSDNSNVVKFFSLLQRDNPYEQMVYYQTGIGTYTSPQLVTSVGQAVSKTLDKMVAWNLEAHVTSGYKFLMQSYAAGDKICLFGFSRGAYTASALAGMLHKVGLLPPWNLQQVPFAYKMYKNAGYRQSPQCWEFKNHFSIEVDIDFMGVWDTVSSVGLIPRWLPMTASNSTIRVFRHALSLDERRAKFEVHRYHHLTEEERFNDFTWDYMRGATRTTGTGKGLAHWLRRRLTVGSGKTPVPIRTDMIKHMSMDKVLENMNKRLENLDKRLENLEDMVNKSEEMENMNNLKENDRYKALPEWLKSRLERKTNVKEVWFAGCHSDVGGGSVANTVEYSLARIPLRWMILEVLRTETRIKFRTKHFEGIGLKSDSASPGGFKVDEDQERKDALSEIHDQLSISPWWWSLEVVPIKRRESKRWWNHRVNFGRGRTVRAVPDTNKVYIHHTVKMRGEANSLRYKPKAKWGTLEPEYVDGPQQVTCTTTLGCAIACVFSFWLGTTALVAISRWVTISSAITASAFIELYSMLVNILLSAIMVVRSC